VVGEAENGEEAVEAYERYQPDVTFLDINMPVKNGVFALREIILQNPIAKVIMLTANDDTSVAESCIYLGARNYIIKGEGPEDLKQNLSAVLGPIEKS